MKLSACGIDLAKSVFQVHGVDLHGKSCLRKQLRRAEMLAFFVKLEPCLIGMEACGSAHYWARKLSEMGHTVKLMAPQFVKPYVKTNKNDAADAEAICEAVTRPNMRFVAIKTEHQQALLAIHRARQGFVKARTAQANQIRGLLAEFGVVIPQGLYNLGPRLAELSDESTGQLPGSFCSLLRRLTENLKELDQQVRDLEKEIQLWHAQNEASRRLAEIPGIGPITASALVASIGDARCFKNGRQLAAWMGLVPRQHSSGGKQVLLGISKRGDGYLRALLIHGARAVLRHAEHKVETATSWLGHLLSRRNKNIAAVALANKNARRVWALLMHDGRRFRADYVPAGAGT
ncbi:IS110 family transposase [Massilia norwichensis]|uniref:IS110 family transposase n=1 Tax=Massilia norwichensis TaxID=1442366 RepID=A0ABT2AEN4_9BURK|nr:IS110 family transposase [Massilia norwichensis]MCS0592674.1 IS110 family transposase [Massilia norwichensis]